MPLSSAALITGFTSSSKRTRSPMTMASTPGFSPGTNAAHDVSPMKGGIFFQPSMSTAMSSRGNATLTTLSAVSVLAPVMLATRAASMGEGVVCGVGTALGVTGGAAVTTGELVGDALVTAVGAETGELAGGVVLAHPVAVATSVARVKKVFWPFIVSSFEFIA